MQGAIWYQGESNASRAYEYRTLFPAMIRDWRAQWGREFPFYYVQLANYMPAAAQPGESEWAELREAQLMTLAVPNTGMAVIIDIGEADDIHPQNKRDVGKRLAVNALHQTYGTDAVPSGPIFRSMRAEGSRVVLEFSHTGGGLMVQGAELKGFAVAGEDRKWHWAQAELRGNTVVVWSDSVPAPAAVRYGWADNPEGINLYNMEGLPASPFRTDSWPGLTDKRHRTY
jgi:sialate O-acetylesterase